MLHMTIVLTSARPGRGGGELMLSARPRICMFQPKQVSIGQ